jgi:hypothetical protein
MDGLGREMSWRVIVRLVLQSVVRLAGRKLNGLGPAGGVAAAVRMSRGRSPT